jgi:hypothetical protein
MRAVWLWGPRIDLAVFAAPCLIGLLVLALAPRGAWSPDASFLVLVVGVDVAHVWATLFRTYLDPDELRARKAVYAGIPLACLAVSVALHVASPALFWRALAYLAVFHFVRQQIGWTAILRARAGDRDFVDRATDEAAVYLATGVPLLHWHASLPRPFHWFVDGDFVPVPWLVSVLPLADAALIVALVAFVIRQVVRARRGAPFAAGKCVVVASTAASWWAAIVASQSDLAFTALNVLPHGVPYFWLLFSYARARATARPDTPAARVVALGLGAFLFTLVVLGFVEEALWDRLVWHDRPLLFGFLPDVDASSLAHVLVPLLALPQATHYALDAVLWRRKDAGPAQREALGLGTS